MAEVAVIFGGPSPEHDVSVLTGLQAARELAARRQRRRGALLDEGRGVVRGRPGARGDRRSSTACRGRPTPLRFGLGTEGGFVAEGGRLGRARPSSSTSPSSAATAVRARTARCRARSTWPGFATPGRRCPARHSAWTSWPSAPSWPPPACRPCPASRWTSATEDVGFDGPYIVKPRFGGSSIGIEVVADLATARARLGANQHLRAGAVLEPYRPGLLRPAGRRAELARARAVGDRATAADAPGRRRGRRAGDPRLRRQVRRRRGHGRRAAGAAGRASTAASRRPSARRPPRSPGSRRCAGSPASTSCPTATSSS